MDREVVKPSTLIGRLLTAATIIAVLCLEVILPARADTEAALPLRSSALTSSITQLEFGAVALGQSAKKRFVLTNNGLENGADIVIYSLYLNEPDARVFTTDFAGPVTLAGGDSYAIEVTFTPEAAGEATAALFVSHNGDSGIEVFTLSGTTRDAPIARAASIKRAVAPGAPSFGKSLLNGFPAIKPTSLQFGPDNRLYVADMLGTLKVLTVVRNDANDYHVVDIETIDLIKNIPNHDDDGAPNPTVKNRLVTGLLVTGSAQSPVVYVASSDPRIGGGPSHTDTHLDTNSGIVSRLTRSNGQWLKTDLVRGLPRSEENHHGNGMALSQDGSTLYLAMGGNTNQGAVSNNFALLPEYALSAAILEIDLQAIGNSTYDLPTLDDETRPGVNDANDPFGGNDGRNQAKLLANGPVRVHAPGFRNPYDVVLTEAGKLYSIDNGPNAGWGGMPQNEGPTGNCTNALNEPGSTFFDALHYIDAPGYYGGHANPTRGNMTNTFNASNPQSPVFQANPVECDYRGSGSNGSLTEIAASTNGLVEYRASNFGGAMQGDLLTAAFNNKIFRLELNAEGDAVSRKTALFSNVGSIPLDVTAQADDQIFAGTVWTGDFVAKSIVIYEPVDYAGAADVPLCDGSANTGDADGDGYSNVDEIGNDTDPCSAADMPADADGDFVSDLLDSDDDNDGIVDAEDAFALDPLNGRGTSLPVSYFWENNSAPAGFLFNMGFSGLMNNGTTDWHAQFDAANLTAGGAAGVFTIDSITGGDPVQATNNQENGFQFGIDAGVDSPAFTVHTRIVRPFAGAVPGPHQSMGMYIGTGDQDNYIKWVANAHASASGGFQFASEAGGAFKSLSVFGEQVLGADAIDLMLQVLPASGEVHALYSITRDGVQGDLVPIGPVASLPSAWLTGQSGLAVGIIATSFGAAPYTGTWDFVEVLPQNVLTPDIIDDDPQDPPVCVGAAGAGDDDGDGYSNSDELANGTDPCSAVDSPADADNDFVSDLIDSDDDNDGIVDSDDVFALDPLNGRGTALPVSYRWQVGDQAPGFLFNRGFSGLMNNGVTDWQAQFDTASLDSSGATGVFTVTDIPGGDPIGATNTQKYGFQFGIDAGVDSPAFTVHTRLPNPFHDAVPGPHQSMGMYIGTGDQDNYIKWVVNSHASVSGGLQLASEAGGSFQSVALFGEQVLGADAVDLLLQVLPASGEVHALYSITRDGIQGDLVHIGPVATLPTSWLTGQSGLAVGLIATSFGATPYSGSWDFIEVLPQDVRGDAVDGYPGTASGGSTGDPADGGDSGDAGAGTGSDTGGDTGGDSGSDPDAGSGSATDTPATVLMEAEDHDGNDATATHQWSLASDPAAQGGAAMLAGPNIGSLKPGSAGAAELRYLRYFDTPGNYQLWVRGKGDTNSLGEGKNDSVHVGLNGQLAPGGKAIQNFPPNWHWSNTLRSGGTATLQIPTAGMHVVNVWMREDGLLVDSILLTLDTGLDPDGSAPVDDDPDTGGSGTSGDSGDSDTDPDTSDAAELAVLDGIGTLEVELGDYLNVGSGHAWQAVSRDGADAMQALPDSGVLLPTASNSPEVAFDVYFDSPGDYRVWVRGWGDTNAAGEGKSDSVHVGIDGVLDTASAMDQFPPGWSWSSNRRAGGIPTLHVANAGMHRVSVWMREDGIALDKLVLVRSDLATVPSGAGPAVKTFDGDTGPVWTSAP